MWLGHAVGDLTHVHICDNLIDFNLHINIIFQPLNRIVEIVKANCET